MTNSQSVGLTPVQWIAARATLGDDVKPVLDAAPDPAALVNTLVSDGKHADAIRCIAGALPVREGIWWAWVSARHTAQLVYAGGLPPLLRLALDAVEKWINAPSDETRRSAWSAGDALGVGTPTGAAAAAVFMSGGSLALPSAPVTPPPPGIAGSMVSGSVILSVATAPPEHVSALYDAYVKQGLAVIEQLGGWESAIAKTWQALDAQQQEYQQFTAAQATPEAASAPAAQGGMHA